MKKYLGLLSLCFIGLHCSGGSEVGNPSRVGLEVVGVNAPLSRLSARAQNTGTAISEARLVLEEIRFRPLSVCEDQVGDLGDVSFEGPFVVDLLSNSSIPSLEDTTIASGTYCRIELRMAKLAETEVPVGVSVTDSIVNNAFIVRGVRSDSTPFVAILEQDEEFKLENELTGFFVGADSIDTFFIAFDLATWLAGIDLDTARVTSGTITIDKDNNSALLDQLKNNIKTSAKLFRDQDSNGVLDDDEDDVEDELADGNSI